MKTLLRLGGFACVAFGVLALLKGVAGPAFCLLPIHSCLVLGDEATAQLSQRFLIFAGAAAIGTSLLSLSSGVGPQQDA